MSDNKNSGYKSNIATLGAEPEKESTVIIKPEFDPSGVDKLYLEFYKNPSEVPDDVRLYVYTPHHVGSKDKLGLFSDFAPSVVYAINRYQDFHLPFRENTLMEFAHSKLCHLYCTLDKSVMYGFFNRHSAQSKVFNLNSVATIMGHPELTLDATLLDSGVEKDKIREVLFQVKKNATKLLKDVQVKSSGVEHGYKMESNFKYPKDLKEKFGHNLDSIMLYGSSATGEGKDYDNIVVLRNLPDTLYESIKDTKPNEDGKEVGMIFVPEYVLDKFLYVNVSNTLFRDNAKILEGQIDFPIESDRYKIFKEMYHAGFGSGKLVSALNLVYRDPTILFDKPGLFEYFVKLNRFTYHGLMHNKGYVVTDKNEILDALKTEFNYELPQFRPDAKYLQEKFLEANKVSIDIAKKMYDPNLAKNENEALLEVDSQISRRIFTSNYDGKKVFIFKGHEPVREKDVVPAVIIPRNSQGYSSRISDIKYYTELPSEFLIAKRV